MTKTTISKRVSKITAKGAAVHTQYQMVCLNCEWKSAQRTSRGTLKIEGDQHKIQSKDPHTLKLHIVEMKKVAG